MNPHKTYSGRHSDKRHGESRSKGGVGKPRVVTCVTA